MKQIQKSVVGESVSLSDAVKALVSAHAESGELYRSIIQIIQREQPGPKAVRAVLRDNGMQDARICDICRIAYGSPEIVAAYLERLIGFRPALSGNRKARTFKQRLLTVLNNLDSVLKSAGESETVDFKGEKFTVKLKISPEKTEIK